MPVTSGGVEAGATKTFGVVGIDGSGKSTVIGRLVELLATIPGGAITMTCPRFHETPNVPLSALSAQLQAMSNACDALGSFELKMAAMFLQMTIYGPVERFLRETYRPRYLVSERHALVDTLAYGAFYTTMVKETPDGERLEAPLRAALADHGDDAYGAITGWLDSENRRLGRDVSLWGLAPYVSRLLAEPWPSVVATFSELYRTRLPDVVLLLDLPIETATARLAGRGGGGAELHERAEALEMLRKNYQRTLDYLAREHPEVATITIDVGRGQTVDEVADAVIDACGIARS